MDQVAPAAPPEFSARQNDVLEVALRLLVEGGDKALTTAGIARAANCSKESLYKWFGDRDGLLAAMITYQSSKVRAAAGPGARPGREAFRGLLVTFAEDLLTVLSGDVSLALNRLAIGEAGRTEARLGGLVLKAGRRPIEARARSLLEAGRAAGHLAFTDTGDAYHTLYGLIVRDLHVRLLLGDSPDPAERNVPARAATAIDQFLRLHGADEKNAKGPGGDTGPA
ncbi:TetR/AcrR family transcriptional regulator C-terminal domain-containing protein [Chthonobacter rhizosphaerae]|uniref:TetR/AcrR family transcriptional regulator C-terminal domain-containing protein n=1 Tax=Chthonobacter rhizosphaerae TaxID=2735553 RepID=UPI0015EF9EDC